METIVDRIRSLCQQKNTSITKLEVELGYANGTIGKWAKGKKPPPLEKVIAIAERLSCSVAYLQNGGEQKEKPPADGELSELQKEAWKRLRRMDDDMLKKFIQIQKTLMGE